MNPQQKTLPATRPRPTVGSAIWPKLSIVAAVLGAAGSVIGLTVGSIYAHLTPYFLPQALAQDAGDIAVAAPTILISAALVLRGSVRAYPVWLGALGFTVYNYVIYTFSVPFGPLFPLWVAVFGLCLFALIGGVASADHHRVAAHFTRRRTVVVAAWFVIGAAVLFVALWLSEDIPALLNGTTPTSVTDMGLPTNPVHVLDYAFFVPTAVVAGIRLLRGRASAYLIAPAFLVFVVLTCVPILITPFVQTARSEAAAWALVIPIGVLAAATLAMLVQLLRTVRPERPGRSF
ncbi:MAG TPA: hypothetical protein VIM08_02180 [Arthrobacter sp.]